MDVNINFLYRSIFIIIVGNNNITMRGLTNVSRVIGGLDIQSIMSSLFPVKNLLGVNISLSFVNGEPGTIVATDDVIVDTTKEQAGIKEFLGTSISLE